MQLSQNRTVVTGWLLYGKIVEWWLLVCSMCELFLNTHLSLKIFCILIAHCIYWNVFSI